MEQNGFMVRYHSGYKISREQRIDIAILTNAGIPHKVLAYEYGVSRSNVHGISNQRIRLLPIDNIAQTRSEKFLYAQRAYFNPSLSDNVRRIIKDNILDPITYQVAYRFSPDPTVWFFQSVYGITPKPYHSYLNMIRKYALDVLKQHVSQDMVYATIDSAVNGIIPGVSDLEVTTLATKQKDLENVLKNKIDEELGILNNNQREVIELRYRVADGWMHSQVEVGKVLGIEHQSVSQRESRALKKLRRPDRIRKLEEFLEQIGNTN